MDLLQRAQELLQECNDTVASLEEWKTANPTLEVDGLQKMTSALHAEQKFLEKACLVSRLVVRRQLPFITLPNCPWISLPSPSECVRNDSSRQRPQMKSCKPRFPLPTFHI